MSDTKKLTGIFYREETESFILYWDGRQIGGCSREYIQRWPRQEDRDAAWQLLFKKVHLVDLFLTSSPELTIEFCLTLDQHGVLPSKRHKKWGGI